jgi:hypothetical protein
MLQEINDLYLQIQDTYGLRYKVLSPEETVIFIQYQERDTHIYQIAIAKFNDIAPSLSSVEIIEAYAEACPLLRANLGGYMYLHFKKDYIPTMKKAIENDEEVSYLFLGALCKHLGHESASSVLKALESKYSRTKDTALAFVCKLQLLDADLSVRQLLHDKDVRIAKLAEETLKCLWTKQKGSY